MNTLKNLLWLMGAVFMVPYSIGKLDAGWRSGVMEFSRRHGNNLYWSLAKEPVLFWVAAAVWVGTIAGALMIAYTVVFRDEDV